MEAQSYRVSRSGYLWYCCCADKTYDQLVPLLSEHGIVPERTGCLSMCFSEPLVEVIRQVIILYGGLRLIKQLPL